MRKPAGRAETTAKFVEEIKRRIAGESDFSKQSALLEEAAARYPNEPYLEAELASVHGKQQELNAQIDNARTLEGKQFFGEATREWEALRKRYPWFPGIDAEIERIANARRKEKQDAQDRWFRRQAISDAGD